jgi:uncharacterized membrane protein
MLANISESQSTQESITNGMYKHISVRVGNATLSVLNLYSAKDKSKTLAQRVNIVSVTNSEIHISAFLQR